MDNSIYLGSLVINSWGQMPPGDYDISSMTLLTGETGSGKSTMLDALQSVMTAAHHKVMNFNPGQDEIAQGPRRGKTRRSVESYVVGAEYSKFSRPHGAQGYVGAVFIPGKGCMAKPFTALMAVSAVVEGNGETRQAKLEAMNFYIIDGVQLSYSDLMVDAEKGISIPVSEIGAHLKRKFPNIIEFHNRKTDYLSVLYGRFRGRSGPVAPEDAIKAAKAWVQSIAYRPIGNMHDLARDEILQHDAASQQEHVERISSLMRQVSQLRKEGEYLGGAVSRLRSLNAHLGAVRQLHISSTEARYSALVATAANEEKRNAELRQKIQDTEAKIVELQRQQETLNAAKTEYDHQYTMVNARLIGFEGEQQKKVLEDRIAAASLAIAKSLRDLSQTLRAASLLESRAKAVLNDAEGLPRSYKGLEQTLAQVELAYNHTVKTNAGELLREVEGIVKSSSLDSDLLRGLSAKLQALDWSLYEKLYAAMVEGEACLLLALAKEEALLGTKELEATRAVTDLMRQQATLAQGKVNYPRGVDIAISRIREEFPDANAHVLCDLVNPTNPKWQTAIEGYMAGARFSILVDPTWERMVIDYVRQQGLDARVVQGSLCLERRKRMMALPSDSIVHELTTDNELAEAYLWDQFGSVEKVLSTDQLRHTPRGVMMDGKASGSRTMYALNNRAELVFGKAARASHLEVLAGKVADAEREREAIGALKGAFSKMKFALNGLRLPAMATHDFEQQLVEISASQGALNALDLTESQELAAESNRLKVLIKQVEDQLANSRDAVTRAKMDIEASQRQLQGLDSRGHSAREAAREVGGKLVEIATLCPQYNAVARLDALTQEASTAGKDVDSFNAKHADDSKQVFQELAKARDVLSDFNAHVRADERFVDVLPFHVNDASFELGFNDVVRLERNVTDRIEALSGIGLLNNSQQLDKAVASFNDAFAKTFCVEIKNRVEDGIRTLKQLNKTLERMNAGGDRYTMDWSRWEPEMQEYLEFFDAVSKLVATEDVDLFSVTTLEDRHLAVRDKLVALLLDDNQEQATKQLMRIADYRNYRRYDVILDSKHGGQIRFSEWGTGSGGQSETPAYVIRAAILANHMGMFDKGPSLKLMVSDESFAKMDETRARAILRYLSEDLGLQVMCAMPTTKAGALQDEFVRQYSFTRMGVEGNGELDFMTDVDERIFEKDAMHEAWDAQREFAKEQARIKFEETNPAPAADAEALSAVAAEEATLPA